MMQAADDVLLFELEPSWRQVLLEELKSPYMLELSLFLAKERALGRAVYPPLPLIFNAFWKTPLDRVKVVILGQDPYHGPGQAHGLCFSVPDGIPPPPSLVNIFKELEADLGPPRRSAGMLGGWAAQGVFLLNTTLTVRDGEPLSHQGQGWERFTDRVIEKIAERDAPTVFILWGKAAQEKCKSVLKHHKENHLVITSSHPSPLSAHQGFFGSKPFSRANAFLEKNGLSPIDFQK